MKRWILVSFCILLLCRLHGNESVYVLTIPKSGTHLIGKYLALIKKTDPGKKIKFISSHLSESYLLLPKGYFQEHPEKKKLVMVRDLRDVFCSALDYMQRSEHYLDSPVYFDNTWSFLSRKEQLHQTIDCFAGSRKYFFWNYHGKTLPQKMHDFIKRAIEYSEHPNTYVVRYENLIGPKGGSSEEKMRSEMEGINDFLGITLEEEDYLRIRTHLFGNSPTFRKGQVNRWQEEFDEELKDLFKACYGQELIDLGYEENFDW